MTNVPAQKNVAEEALDEPKGLDAPANRMARPRVTKRIAALVAVVAASLLAHGAAARQVPVATAAALVSAVQSARAGDEIVLADGTYALGGSTGANASAAGTATTPIIVRAANPLQAHIRSTAVQAFSVTGPYWRFQDLDVIGVCPSDSTCEHAFHVSGPAVGFQLLRNRISDFNAQLKVNADDQHRMPDNGLVEGNIIADNHARQTSSPVTPVDIDNASGWIIRANTVSDFHKTQGSQVSFGIYAKGGGSAPIFERNLVICALHDLAGGSRVGLSFGGGGMDPALCAPKWGGGTCDPEVTNGIMRNNVVVSCSDVGIYLWNATGSRVLYNTLIATNGIDWRNPSSTGEARGNVLASAIRSRDGGSFTAVENLQNVTPAQLAGWYAAPLPAGDVHTHGDLSAIAGKGVPIVGVTDDFFGVPRLGAYTLGAVQAPPAPACP